MKPVNAIMYVAITLLATAAAIFEHTGFVIIFAALLICNSIDELKP